MQPKNIKQRHNKWELDKEESVWKLLKKKKTKNLKKKPSAQLHYVPCLPKGKRCSFCQFGMNWLQKEALNSERTFFLASDKHTAFFSWLLKARYFLPGKARGVNIYKGPAFSDYFFLIFMWIEEIFKLPRCGGKKKRRRVQKQESLHLLAAVDAFFLERTLFQHFYQFNLTTITTEVTKKKLFFFFWCTIDWKRKSNFFFFCLFRFSLSCMTSTWAKSSCFFLWIKPETGSHA